MRYGKPHSIIRNNGTKFSIGELAIYCRKTEIRLDLASVAHPQSNGQVERTNGLILQDIKPRLEAPLHRAAGAWAEELSSVLWSLRTIPNRSTGFTPFFWFMGRKPSYQQTYCTILPALLPTTKMMLKNQDAYPWIC